MIELNLKTKSREQELVKQYLEQNVSQTLADKINNGVSAEKDGKPLISRKNLDGFFSFASEEARKLADKSARSACIEDSTVYGWAIHYFEEDSIIGTLYYIDGTEYKPASKAKVKTTTPVATAPKVEKKPDCQFSLFDFMGQNDKKPDVQTKSDTDDEVENTIRGQVVTEDGEIIDYEDFDGDIEEVIDKPAIVENKPTGTPLYQRYKKIQNAYPTSIIAMRLGHFYEVFGEHATTLADELDLTLTGRDCGLESRVPMIGFPYHAAEAYFKKINTNHNLVIFEGNDDATTRYLPKIDYAPAAKTATDNKTITKLKAVFGKNLEVII
jgi:hypothetical protein